MPHPIKLCYGFSIVVFVVSLLLMGFFPKHNIFWSQFLYFGIGAMVFSVFISFWELFLRIKKLEGQDNGDQQTRSG